MTFRKNSAQDATQHALKMVLAAAEEDWPSYRELCKEASRRRPRFNADLIMAITVVAANSSKAARPDGWNAYLRLNIHDLDLDPQNWGDVKDSK